MKGRGTNVEVANACLRSGLLRFHTWPASLWALVYGSKPLLAKAGAWLILDRRLHHSSFLTISQGLMVSSPQLTCHAAVDLLLLTIQPPEVEL